MNLQHDNFMPTVRLAGQIDHGEFREAIELLRATARVSLSSSVAPELVVVAQSVPYAISNADIDALRRQAPLAGVVGLLGSWCEGETRTGRPWPGVERFYWYEFPAWWRRQLAIRSAGLCPDYARWPNDDRAPSATQNPQSEIVPSQAGLVVLRVATAETAVALSDVLRPAGYASVWQRPGRRMPWVSGAVAGIWEGAQLCPHEENDLTAFARAMTRHTAPVVTLLDFPRGDRCQRARECGAAAVLGKPWRNADLVDALTNLSEGAQRVSRAA